jgi:hypothetical protein
MRFRLQAACFRARAFRLAAQTPLPGSAPLTTQGDLVTQMLDGISDYLLRATAESIARRPTAPPNRECLKKIIGVRTPR